MKALLKTEQLRNFKGVIDQTFTLGQVTEVCGTNGTGKTTLFDAFTFALFGKDSNGRTDFGFKRREKDGQVVHNAEYGVRLVFDIDGEERTFERVVTEKWVKPKGGKEKVLSGHETAYYVNNVKCTMKDYNASVSEIAMEDVLRMLTDVFYFTSLNNDQKKAMLLRMAYGTSDSAEADAIAATDVVSKQPNFATFVDELNGLSLRDYNVKIQADINRIKSELDEIPLKIAAKQEAMPAEEDWEGLQSVIDENRDAMEQIDKQIADDSARVAGSEQKKNALRTELSNLTLELTKAQNAIRTKVENDERDKRKAVADLDAEYTLSVKDYNRYAEQLKNDNIVIGGIENVLAELRGTYKAIKDGTYQYADSELTCPTCHRPYDIALLQEQKLTENVSMGKAKATELAQMKEEVAVLTEKMKELRTRIDAAHQQKDAINFVPADVNALCKADPTCIDISNKIEAVRKQINEWPVEPTESELQLEKKALNEKIAALQMQLGQREVRSNISAQIEQLVAKQRDLNAQLAELECKQDTAKEFQKAKDRELLAKVNDLFTMVTWDFVTEQLNGNDRISCNCYINGKPYGECNHALQVNGGLDIINAIARSNDTYLPIFIDNAESVVDYIHTDSQLVLLKVDENAKQLTFNIK